MGASISGDNLREQGQMPDIAFPVWAFHLVREESDMLLFILHWHEYFEALYLVRGRMRIECEGECITAVPGDTIVFNPNDLHRCSGYEGVLELYCLVFDLRLVSAQCYDPSYSDYIHPLHANQIRFPHVLKDCTQFECLFRLACDEFERREIGYELQVRSALMQFMAQLLRHCPKVILPHKQNDEQTDAVISYIEAHYAEEISLADLAAVAYMNKNYLCRRFKQSTGKTVSAYITGVRVREAQRLLAETKMSIAHIAELVGVHDENYFTRVFARSTGITPSQMRREYQKRER